MEVFRIILSGRFEFGTHRTFENVRKLYEERSEVHYRNQVLLKAENHFDEEALCFNLPRAVFESNKKTWENTIRQLEFIAGYAISGAVFAYLTQSGKKIEEFVIEPRGDRDAILAFKAGKELEREGQEQRAHEAYSKAIEKFERHAMAYERRGYTNIALEKMIDALYDFDKSIGIYPHNPGAYFGKGLVFLKQKKWKDAVDAFKNAHTFSIPHQPIFWKAKRLKGECLMELHGWQEAEKEFRAFVNRKFEQDNPNLKDLARTWLNLGTSLLEQGKKEEAIKAFQQAIDGDEPAKKQASEILEKLI